jgi:arylsulfatase A-like enzyme
VIARTSAAGVLAITIGCGGPPPLPAEIEAPEVLHDLETRLEPTGPRVAVATGRRAPRRWARVAEPASALRTRIPVPEETALVLEFAVAVERTPRGRPLRFVATVDGAEVVAETLDPARRHRDRRWRTARIDLAAHAHREVELVLRAITVGEGPPAGLAAWSRVELVRVHRRARTASTPDAPNVLLLVVDTLRADALGCYGAIPTPSPVLDGLARSGVLFDDCVAPAPWTLPSVATIFTGRHPREHGVAVGDDPAADEVTGASLATAIPTLASVAQRAGVTTFGLSANPLVGQDTGLATGFEVFDDPPAADPVRRWVSGRSLNARFLRWAREHRRVRFLAYLHYMEVHSPYAGAAAHTLVDAPSDVRSGDASRIGRRLLAGSPAPAAAHVEHLRKLYRVAIGEWDRMLGELLGGLDELGLGDRTVVVVTADHGEEFLEHGHLAHGKQLFDESIRVPLVIAGPGITPGRRPGQVQLTDLLPTIAARLGAVAPPGLGGADLLAREPPPARPAFAEARRALCFGEADAELAMVRQPPWKLMWSPGSDRIALFNLTDDPGERVDRAAAEPVAAHLLASAREYWQRGGLAEPVHMVPGVVEKLRALGYAE